MNRSRPGLAFVVVLAIVSVVVGRLSAQTWQSNIVRTGASGKLEYSVDKEGNQIPDFSYAGYRNGEVPIPEIAVVDSVSPVAGDNTSNIQAAINRVALRPLDVLGKEVATLVNEMRPAGVYTIRWDATKLPSGVYFYRLEAAGYVVSNKLMFVK